MYDSYCGGGFSVYVECVLLSGFLIVRSRKFMLLLTSVSNVKFNFGCSLLIYWCSCLICLLPLYRSNMSSTYLYQCIILSACLLFCWLSVWVYSI